MMPLIPVILCGGAGTRLWPLSRQAYPKQLLNLYDDHSLLQNTLLRLKQSKLALSDPIIVCNTEHRFIVAEQLRAININNATIFLEPISRNTAAATIIAALHAKLHDTLLILPADHQITNVTSFSQAISHASELAEHNYLVTLGIQAHYPETGFGYLQIGEAITNHLGYHVKKFIEKPSKEKAEEYIKSQHYLWNAGIFILKASSLIHEAKQLAPDILQACQKSINASYKDLDFIRLDKKIFQTAPNISLDYAIMEQSKKIAVVPVIESGWSDLGSFASLYHTQNKDKDQNVKLGDVLTYNTHRCYIQSQHRLIAAADIDDHLIIETADAILVAKINSTQSIKILTEQLNKQQRKEVAHHCRVYRPWGYYESIDQGKRFQVKRIAVNPGASLSLQSHIHRAEHWIIIEGIATIWRDNEVFKLTANESTFIKPKQKHRLANQEKTELILIEVQTGDYLGEDDITRFEDIYGRIDENAFP